MSAADAEQLTPGAAAAAAAEFWGPGEVFFQFRVCHSILLNLIVWKSFLTLNMSKHEWQPSVFFLFQIFLPAGESVWQRQQKESKNYLIWWKLREQ